MGILNLFKRKEKSVNKFKKNIDVKLLKLNVKKDIIDKRDYTISKIAKAVTLPEEFSLRQFCTPVKNQQNIGACTGFGSTAGYEVLRNKNTKQQLDLSELFTYYNAREMEGTIDKDAGAYVRDVCKSGVTQGFCLEEYWPYIPSKFKEKPSWSAYFCAKYYRLSGYYRCNTADEIKQALVNGLPVVFGAGVWSNFLSFRGDVYKSIGGSPAGGHCMLVVGYSNAKNAFLVKNSWGTEFGNRGYVWIEYGIFMQYLYDAWALEYAKPTTLQKIAKAILI